MGYRIKILNIHILFMFLLIFFTNSSIYALGAQFKVFGGVAGGDARSSEVGLYSDVLLGWVAFGGGIDKSFQGNSSITQYKFDSRVRILGFIPGASHFGSLDVGYRYTKSSLLGIKGSKMYLEGKLNVLSFISSAPPNYSAYLGFRMLSGSNSGRNRVLMAGGEYDMIKFFSIFSDVELSSSSILLQVGAKLKL